MSWYLANEDGIIDQFASGLRLKQLREASWSEPVLKDFFTVGATKNIALCQYALYSVAKKTKDKSINSTAKGLAAMLRGQTLVWITQGMTGFDGGEQGSAKESLPRPNPVKPIKPTVVRKAKKKAAPKT